VKTPVCMCSDETRKEEGKEGPDGCMYTPSLLLSWLTPHRSFWSSFLRWRITVPTMRCSSRLCWASSGGRAALLARAPTRYNAVTSRSPVISSSKSSPNSLQNVSQKLDPSPNLPILPRTIILISVYQHSTNSARTPRQKFSRARLRSFTSYGTPIQTTWACRSYPGVNARAGTSDFPRTSSPRSPSGQLSMRPRIIHAQTGYESHVFAHAVSRPVIYDLALVCRGTGRTPH